MNFFDLTPMDTPCDAEYYFNVYIVNIAIRKSLKGEFEDIWDLREILGPRPIALHFFAVEDDALEYDKKWDIKVAHHCILEISKNLGGVSYYSSSASDKDFDEGQYRDLNNFWRF